MGRSRGRARGGRRWGPGGSSKGCGARVRAHRPGACADGEVVTAGSPLRSYGGPLTRRRHGARCGTVRRCDGGRHAVVSHGRYLWWYAQRARKPAARWGQLGRWAGGRSALCSGTVGAGASVRVVHGSRSSGALVWAVVLACLPYFAAGQACTSSTPCRTRCTTATCHASPRASEIVPVPPPFYFPRPACSVLTRYGPPTARSFLKVLACPMASILVASCPPPAATRCPPDLSYTPVAPSPLTLDPCPVPLPRAPAPLPLDPRPLLPTLLGPRPPSCTPRGQVTQTRYAGCCSR